MKNNINEALTKALWESNKKHYSKCLEMEVKIKELENTIQRMESSMNRISVTEYSFDSKTITYKHNKSGLKFTLEQLSNHIALTISYGDEEDSYMFGTILEAKQFMNDYDPDDFWVGRE